MQKIKKAYTISCSSSLRDGIEELARKKEVNAGDIARSVILTFAKGEIDAFHDPGEPKKEDREEITLKKGQEERLWKRKPRLQLRLMDGLDNIFIRKALGLALALDNRQINLILREQKQIAAQKEHEKNIKDDIDRLKTTFAILAFEPVIGGVRNVPQALYVMGFPPNSQPNIKMVQARFRMLARVYHPDGDFGSHDRMMQLNEAKDVLAKHAYGL